MNKTIKEQTANLLKEKKLKLTPQVKNWALKAGSGALIAFMLLNGTACEKDHTINPTTNTKDTTISNFNTSEEQTSALDSVSTTEPSNVDPELTEFLLNYKNDEEYIEKKNKFVERGYNTLDKYITCPDYVREELNKNDIGAATIMQNCAVLGIGDELYIYFTPVARYGDAVALYKYTVGNEITDILGDLLKTYVDESLDESNRKTARFDYFSLLNRIINNMNGELLAQNLGKYENTSSIDGDMFTHYNIQENDNKYTLVKDIYILNELDKLDEWYVKALGIDYQYNILINEHSRFDKLSSLFDNTQEVVGDIDFYSVLDSDYGIKEVYSNENQLTAGVN